MNGTSTTEEVITWISEPHPDLLTIIMREVVTGWTPETVSELWGGMLPISLLASLLLMVGIGYCALRIRQIRRAEHAQFRKAARPVASEDVPRTQMRWSRIMEHANSADENQWRLAILEADIMLSELLDLLGYRGETMAEKMKQVAKGDFNSIDLAWDAHKVRNRIAHEGAQLQLSEREKNRVIGMYEQIFREFNFI